MIAVQPRIIINMKNAYKYFTTYDLNLSAVLVSQNFTLEEVEKSGSGKALFYFKKSDELLELIDRYWKNQLQISPQALFTSLKSIKNRLYSGWK